jgi:microcystin-dependent protein
VETLKSDLSLIETGVNAHTADESIHFTLSTVYPVGCIYTSTVATNPATLFGFGTWTAFGAGRVLVGFDSTQTEFDTAEETGGEKTVTLTASQIPTHSHPNSLTGTTTFASSGHGHGPGTFHAAIGAVAGQIASIGYVAGYNSGGPGSATYAITGNYIGSPGFNHYTPVYGGTGGPGATASVGLSNANNTGGGGSHNNLQPYMALNYIIKT